MTYHILNGDALLNQFPVAIQGERIVMRECLVDGKIEGDLTNDFFPNRARFISTHYDGFTEEDYLKQTLPEIKKIQDIPKAATLYYWFERDLFCQVNWWFSLFLVSKLADRPKAFLVLPSADLQYGFGGMTSADLVKAKTQAKDLSGFERQLDQLWPFFQQKNYNGLLTIAKQLKSELPFLLPAVQAEIDRQPTMDGLPGKPVRLLREIMDELETEAFGPVFKEFCQRGAIYGFGDLQVKRIYDGLLGKQAG